MPRKKAKEKRLICHLHDDIIEECDFLLETFEEFKTKVTHIKQLAEDAKERGQAMEDRLYDYKRAIEGLGFTRDIK